MNPPADHLDVAARMADKEAARQADLQAIASGARAPEQVAQDNASFAFGPDRARINLSASKHLA